ncbi:MFS transporter [Dankookia rubra]|uniref:hypothetical protein n=1 Tax=Dankookia rubra TaxID=1442381 RepID=UPI001F4F1CCB|nr:hypothetical protein [Dankookia rubra]
MAPIAFEHETGNVARLTIAQALAGANSTVVYATGAIVGHSLAPSPAMATLPISIFVVGLAACILPAGAIARRHGRRATFLAGTGCGVLVGLLGGRASMDGFDSGPSWFWPEMYPEMARVVGELGLTAFPQGAEGDVMVE